MFPLKLLIPLAVPLFVLSWEVPLWISTCSGLFIVWRLLADLMKWKKPSRKITGALSIIFLIMVFMSFETLLGREAAGSFLFILTGLKILEYENKEDESLFLILLGLFLICAVFLFNIDLLLSLGLGLILVYLTYLLTPENLRIKSPTVAWKIYFKAVLTALPLAVFLFVFFPRLSESLWKLGAGKGRLWANSGFSEDLRPGSVAEVVKSTRLVFRSDFLNSEKLNRDLYWRGEVLSKPVGWHWKKASHLREYYLDPRNKGEPDYRVLLEPMGQRWLFTLEGTQFIEVENFRIVTTPNSIYRIAGIPEKVLEYFGTLDYIANTEEHPEEFLELPPDFSPKVKALVNSWRLKNLSAEKKLAHIYDYFHDKNFRYTLNPVLDALTLDQFLFESKQGFCEHYASSLALLLRTSGVPARVVVGFQGGIYNEFGKFWMVREKEAHAWVEYLNSKGRWKRADATAVVAPLRLELGAEDFFNLPEEMQTLKVIDETITQLRRKLPFYSQIMYWIQGLNYQWTSWLMNFDLEKQKELLSKVTLPVQSLLAFAFLLCLAVAFLIQQLRIRIPQNPEDRYYSEVLRWKEFQKINYIRSLGPTETLKQAQALLPHLSKELQLFFNIYIRIAYGSEEDQARNLKESYYALRKKYRRRTT